MVAPVMFDTLKFATRLKEAGVAPPLAEAQARAIIEALGDTDVATKADIRMVRSELGAEIRELKTDVRVMKWIVWAGVAWLTAIHMLPHTFRLP